MNKKNHIIAMIAIMVVIAGGAFYGGMQYGTSKATAQLVQNRNGSGFGGAANGAAGGQGGQRGMRGGANGGGFSGGQITAKDDTSITIKTRNGSSQIVFYSPSTTVDKSVAGSASDLSVGAQVTASGSANPDGSLAATNIAIRPADANGGPQGGQGAGTNPGN